MGAIAGRNHDGIGLIRKLHSVACSGSRLSLSLSLYLSLFVSLLSLPSPPSHLSLPSLSLSVFLFSVILASTN